MTKTAKPLNLQMPGDRMLGAKSTEHSPPDSLQMSQEWWVSNTGKTDYWKQDSLQMPQEWRVLNTAHAIQDGLNARCYTRLVMIHHHKDVWSMLHSSENVYGNTCIAWISQYDTTLQLVRASRRNTVICC